MTDSQNPLSTDNDVDPYKVVRDIAANWSRLGLAGERTELVSLYADDAIFFGSLPNMYFGRPGVAEYFEAVPLSLLTAVRFDWQQVRYIAPSVINAGGLAYFSMEVDGEEISWRFGITWVLAKSGSGWRIAAHHASRRELET